MEFRAPPMGITNNVQSRPIATELTRFVGVSKHKGA